MKQRPGNLSGALYKNCHSDIVHLPGVGLEDQLTCRRMLALCQEILVHSFVAVEAKCLLLWITKEWRG